LKLIPGFIPALFQHLRNSTTTSSVVHVKRRRGQWPQTPKNELLCINESLWQLLNDPNAAD